MQAEPSNPTISDNHEPRTEPAAPAPAAGCCGGPAPDDTAACCALDAEVKSTGGAGCGCSTKAAPRTGCC